MRKKIFVAMMIGCMILGGCGGSGDSTATTDSDNYEAEYDAEDDVLDASDGLAGEDYASDEDVESEENETEDEEHEGGIEPGEAKGVVAMVSQMDPSHAATSIQLICINPDSGAQDIIAEWHLETPASANTEVAEPRFYLPDKSSVYGNDRDWLSSDLTKLSITAVFADNERHAGWLNSKSEFFDVTKTVGAEHEGSFANPNPVIQSALGFRNDDFAFYEDFSNGDQLHYYVPADNISEDTISEADLEDWYFNKAFTSTAASEFYPTCWVTDSTCIADMYDHSGYPQSVMANIETEEITEYLPSSERYNWSGVLSPEGETIAFLSVSQQSNGIVEVYTVPTSGGEPTQVELEPNEELLLDTTTLTNDDLYGPTSIRNYTSYHFYFLEWR